MVEEIMSGASIVLEVRAQNASVVFRDFCGPADPVGSQMFDTRRLFSVAIRKEIARHIRPTTLRALYGKDKVKNAVHCTDLAEDSTLEVRESFACIALDMCLSRLNTSSEFWTIDENQR